MRKTARFRRVWAQIVVAGLFILYGSGRLLSDPSNETFFPMAKGDVWVYDTFNKKKNDHFEMKVEIEGPWEIKPLGLDKAKEAPSAQHWAPGGMIMTQKDKRGTMRQFLLKNEKGIFADKLALSKTLTPEINTRFTPALPTVIFPLIPGTKVHWEGRLKVTGLMNKSIILDGEVVGWEDLDVPAGHFHAIKLHFHEKRGDDIIDEDAWYAEGVGQVKYNGGQFVKELKSYRIGASEQRSAGETAK